jgi:hypothetical protein
MRRSLEHLLDRTHITQHLSAKDLHDAFSEGFASVVEQMRRFDVVE